PVIPNQPATWLLHVVVRRRRDCGICRDCAKRVSHAMYCSHELRILRVVPQRSPDFANEHIQIGFRNVAVGPDFPQKFILADNVRSTREHDAKQVERFRRKMNVGPVTEKLSCIRIDDELLKTRSHGYSRKLRKPYKFLRTMNASL